MRRRHWWGAAAGAGVLASMVFVAPAALASPVAPARPATAAAKATPLTKPTPPKSNRAKHNPGHHHEHPGYPANRTCSVKIDAPSKVRRGRTIKVTAKASINNTPIAGVAAGLYGSIDGGKTWKLYKTTTTNRDGVATFAHTPQHNALIRVVVAGSKYSDPGQSDGHQVNVKR